MKKAILYILIAILLIVIIVMTFFPNMIYAFQHGVTGNVVAEDAGDKCTHPEGTSVEDWQTHMSHHPNIYRECLE
ncbi:hypothetical protein COU62_02430 [Candidatus Pacearchaeota archaeon CG10_big_fil_rev_8_21_14_0_10_35_219]|nr:hypothetical protein [Candidatus Pacearchaeota archaeon]OIO41996.1 MAG: hypothetical protein AUJ63_04570 [Candidatus Pacearchaeota archaeon CG1_02_35_32]PIO07823.1 MAG: hypothetical protein COU62_02430 [Candidatus Pacearchaeota archaeon CG10_big_fil_rev_8_21_14_0_10_35_219]PIY81045.1 MAG: hypothetical protein COY79_04540 [Candidatus Pacearchaeota archaeon CG_4_10_14_0_8_um_filter_35_169]PIZ79914.1 MAG: hypothetical protein COY00_02845 [Candidatus Pacearchaeota archaeon CG_4_10_14_0_2_um_filt